MTYASSPPLVRSQQQQDDPSHHWVFISFETTGSHVAKDEVRSLVEKRNGHSCCKLLARPAERDSRGYPLFGRDNEDPIGAIFGRPAWLKSPDRAFRLDGMFITHFAVLYLGRAGLFALAGIMGVTDVDPFILSLAQSASAMMPVTLAGGAIIIAAASNNLIKGIYAYGFGDRRTGTQGLALLTVLALLGLLPLFL